MSDIRRSEEWAVSIESDIPTKHRCKFHPERYPCSKYADQRALAKFSQWSYPSQGGHIDQSVGLVL